MRDNNNKDSDTTYAYILFTKRKHKTTTETRHMQWTQQRQTANSTNLCREGVGHDDDLFTVEFMYEFPVTVYDNVN